MNRQNKADTTRTMGNIGPIRTAETVGDGWCLTSDAPAPKKNITRNNNDFLDVTAMIRSLQRSEGNLDCFRRGHKDCEEIDCAWRDYCLTQK
ncbi:MAG: hypothetical protein HKM93_04805 [Desulfobacteraceae bacterium]|nr:hypothetical protein [Desulfobacteraceae bacterium]